MKVLFMRSMMIPILLSVGLSVLPMKVEASSGWRSVVGMSWLVPASYAAQSRVQSVDINAAITHLLQEVQRVDVGLLSSLGYASNATYDVVGAIISNTTDALPSAYGLLQNTTNTLLSSENTLQTIQSNLLTLLSYNMTCEGTVAEGSDSWFTSQDGQTVGLAALVVGSHFMLPAWQNVIKPAALAMAHLAGECWRSARKDPIMRFLEKDTEVASGTQKNLWIFLHALKKEIEQNTEKNPLYFLNRVRGDGVSTDDSFTFGLPGMTLELTRQVGNKNYQSFFVEGQTLLNKQDAGALLGEFEPYVNDHLNYDQFKEKLQKMSARGVMHAFNPSDEDIRVLDTVAFEFGLLSRRDKPKENDDDILDSNEMVESAQFSSRYCLKLIKTPIEPAPPPVPPIMSAPILNRGGDIHEAFEDNV